MSQALLVFPPLPNSRFFKTSPCTILPIFFVTHDSIILNLTFSQFAYNFSQVCHPPSVTKLQPSVAVRLMRMLRLAKLGAIWERIEARIGSIFFVQCVALIRPSICGGSGPVGRKYPLVNSHSYGMLWIMIFFNG